MIICTVGSTAADPLSSGTVSISPGRFVTLSTRLCIVPGSKMILHRAYSQGHSYLFAVDNMVTQRYRNAA
jgi:hypothetical protein